MIYFNPKYPDLIYKLSDTEDSMWITIGKYNYIATGKYNYIATGKYNYIARNGFHIFKLKDSKSFIRVNKFIPYRLSHLIENFDTDNNNDAWKSEINNILEYLSRG